MVPPMARAESYGDIARLEQLLDEHANVAAMDPAKLPAVRAQIWTLIQAAKLDHDLGLAERPGDDHFDEMILHVDGWLCEIKDSQIRDGLHVLGVPPGGDDRVDLVLAMLRARQIWGGSVALPGLREALGLADDASRTETDAVEARAHALVAGMEAAGWAAAAVALGGRRRARLAVRRGGGRCCGSPPTRWCRGWKRTTDELDAVLHALSRRVRAGRAVGLAAARAGQRAADRPQLLLGRPAGDPVAAGLGDRPGDGRVAGRRATCADTGSYPASVGLSVWGTSAMRTSGDDVGEVLALLGVRPVWDEASRRVTGLEPVPLDELGRPRIDVTVRISGFFRDAFPHVVTMLDDAVTTGGRARRARRAELRAGARRRPTWPRTATGGGRPPGCSAPSPARTGRGCCRSSTRATGATTPTWPRCTRCGAATPTAATWTGCRRAPDMEAAYRRIAVAAKNVDTREHDIADSDDYFQYHGGMVATVRALTGSAPRGLHRRLDPAGVGEDPVADRGDRRGCSARGW